VPRSCAGWCCGQAFSGAPPAKFAPRSRGRTVYVRRLYRADPTDPRHYHLVVDSTALPLDAVVDMILAALSSFPATLTAPTPRRNNETNIGT
jgi:hypothetical protein